MASSHRFIIYGAGSIGSVFGGMLARAGHQVNLVGRGPNMEAIREKGLVIDGLLGDYKVDSLETFSVLSGVSQEPTVTAVFISVKSNDTAAAVQDLVQNGLVGDNTLVVSLQNGLGNLELIRDAFGPVRSFGGRVIFGAQLVGPGHVHVSVWADKVLIGGPGTGTPPRPGSLRSRHQRDSGQAGNMTGRKLATLLTECGIETEEIDNIEAALWGKVLYNVGFNPLSALLDVSYGELGREKNARRLLIQLIEEAFMVASREIKLPWSSADEYLEHFFGKLLPSTESHLSSMLQDLDRGRETEIDAITGQVIRRADLLSLPVPANRVVYDLVKAKVATKRS
jgi:2-dehydropantoate 2-reductase